MNDDGARVPPWTAWVSDQPTIVIHARCHPRQVLDAFAAAARDHKLGVTRLGEYHLRAARGSRGGHLVADMLHLGLLLGIHRLQVDASLTTPRTPDACAVLVTCTAGAKEPRVSTTIARMLDDAVRRLLASGTAVEVAGWYARPADALADQGPQTPGS